MTGGLITSMILFTACGRRRESFHSRSQFFYGAPLVFSLQFLFEASISRTPFICV